MKKEEVLTWIVGYKFLAIDHKLEGIHIIMEDVENGYRGYFLSWDNRGYSLSPEFIASTFIHATKNNYDFTNDIDEAFNYFNRWNYVEL